MWHVIEVSGARRNQMIIMKLKPEQNIDIKIRKQRQHEQMPMQDGH